MNWKTCLFDPKGTVKFSEISSQPVGSKLYKERLKSLLKQEVDQISKLQNKLFAENQKSVLILFQGMDSSGKDSAIKHIMRGVNPQGVNVTSFKHPTGVELEHDYLWRHAQKMPEHGQIAIFNRSHYENVLISRVHPKIVLSERLPSIAQLKDVDDDFWRMRYKQINDFEKRNIENGTYIVKIFLHLSKEEQCKRFIARLEDRTKHWKFSFSDITERNYWEDYQHAYEQAILHTSTKLSPWYIIPADDKWVARVLISKIIYNTLKQLNPSFPIRDEKEKKRMWKEKVRLMNENKNC